MSKEIIIALDCMGGDNAPGIVISGAALALDLNSSLKFLMFGDVEEITPLLSAYPHLKARSELIHTDEAVSSDDKPSAALRSGKNSSMRLAIDSVKDGRASCIVSAGNTGALMAMAKIVLRPIAGIDRPAIASVLPTMSGSCVMLDLGANVNCSARHLIEFSLLGTLYAQSVLGKRNPTYALLNIGTEEIKGLDYIREAAALLKEHSMPGKFLGFVEGDGITRGDADVVVSDGFIGNVALKTAEGTAQLLTSWLRQAIEGSLLSKIGYLFMKPSLNKLKKQADPRRYNGAMFLGLKGICVKSHGGTDAIGFANAIKVAAELVMHNYNQKIEEELEKYQDILIQTVDL